MGSQFSEIELTADSVPAPVRTDRASRSGPAKASVFVVEDEELVRETLVPLLEGAGYDVSFAENGCEALARLRANVVPDIILLDLAMPSMNGWEFRAIQKSDPVLGDVPVVAITADGSPQARAISAEAYFRKPFEAQALLDTIERILAGRPRQATAPAERADRLNDLARLASSVGHEINNPLTVVLLNLNQSIHDLVPSILALETPLKSSFTNLKADDVRANLLAIGEMLEDGKLGAERIRDTVAKLVQLNPHDREPRVLIDTETLIEKAISRVWNQLGERTRLIKCFGKVPAVLGNSVALERVFVNLLLNAVDAIPADETDWNEIRVVTRVAAGTNGAEAVVEIHDSGMGLSPMTAARVFEPLFSTKPIGSGDGTGLGLSTARQTVLDHGGRVTIEREAPRGAVARVFLPVAAAQEATTSETRPADASIPDAGYQELKK